MKTKHPELKSWIALNKILYNQNPLYIFKIIKTKLTNRHYNNFLANNLELKRPINWLKILLAIIIILELL